MCGGSGASTTLHHHAGGLSPRVRGKQSFSIVSRARPRSIPACAGEAAAPEETAYHAEVYPRVCGGSKPDGRRRRHSRGLSPRVRGKLFRNGVKGVNRGSIPACAGEATPAIRCWLIQRVYPRVCGGSPLSSRAKTAYRGLSPRVRGKLLHKAEKTPQLRSIPACAGEAKRRAAALIWQRVYPRVCGGSQPGRGGRPAGAGLSPRVRGKRAAVGRKAMQGGSIPACAGEARFPSAVFGPAKVYPRVCGGSSITLSACVAGGGLSPRVRGKRASSASTSVAIGSIPACAGEAHPATSTMPPSGVYPRVCGGSLLKGLAYCYERGLSPRVRGKPPFRPRRKAAKGLSPRVRGKRSRTGRHSLHRRSIPACAGEAIPARRCWTLRTVYPRVCGGSYDDRGYRYQSGGLSPRVRGKLRVPFIPQL